MAIYKILFASLVLYLLIESSLGATKERLFSELRNNTFEVTVTTSREEVLDAGKDKLSISWKLVSGAMDADIKLVKVKLCYAPISQVDRPWRKTKPVLYKDKTCPHKIVAKPYVNDKTAQSFEYTLERDIPTATYFVRAYAFNEMSQEVAYGQSADAAKKIGPFFSVQAISGRHASLDIASICFSVFSVLALVVFFVNEKRKARIEQRQ